jgi:hypothetical protein
MAAGPKLQAITAGSALIADTVMQNFQALADFLRSIPANSLLQYKWTQTFTATLATGIGVNSTAYGIQYHRVNFGASPEQLEITSMVERAAALGGGDTVTIEWQKTTPANGSYPRFADVWSTLGATITYNAANTVVLADNVQNDTPPARFAQRAVLSGAPPLADGDWVRCIVFSVGLTSACTMISSNITLKAALRS